MEASPCPGRRSGFLEPSCSRAGLVHLARDAPLPPEPSIKLLAIWRTFPAKGKARTEELGDWAAGPAGLLPKSNRGVIRPWIRAARTTPGGVQRGLIAATTPRRRALKTTRRTAAGARSGGRAAACVPAPSS